MEAAPDGAVDIVPLDRYDSARAKIAANLQWICAKAYGIGGSGRVRGPGSGAGVRGSGAGVRDRLCARGPGPHGAARVASGAGRSRAGARGAGAGARAGVLRQVPRGVGASVAGGRSLPRGGCGARVRGQALDAQRSGCARNLTCGIPQREIVFQTDCA